MSLPLAFRTDAGTVPRDVPYLAADPARAAAWRARLGPPGRRRVGIVWSGSRGLPNDKRSMTFRDIEPLLRPDYEWVSLQKEVPAQEAAALARHPDIRPLGAHLTDFAETAGVLESIDLLVTVDTSVAHLAGAMAKPVWILLPLHQHDWRWQLAGETTPWYPTARLVRQARDGDWAELVARVGVALAAWSA